MVVLVVVIVDEECITLLKVIWLLFVSAWILVFGNHNLAFYSNLENEALILRTQGIRIVPLVRVAINQAMVSHLIGDSIIINHCVDVSWHGWPKATLTEASTKSADDIMLLYSKTPKQRKTNVISSLFDIIIRNRRHCRRRNGAPALPDLAIHITLLPACDY